MNPIFEHIPKRILIRLQNIEENKFDKVFGIDNKIFWTNDKRSVDRKPKLLSCDEEFAYILSKFIKIELNAKPAPNETTYSFLIQDFLNHYWDSSIRQIQICELYHKLSLRIARSYRYKTIIDLLAKNHKNQIYYRSRTNEIVEVHRSVDVNTKKPHDEIQIASPETVALILEQNFKIYSLSTKKTFDEEQKKDVSNTVEIQKNLKPVALRHVMASKDFKESLPKLNRTFKWPLLYIKNNQLIIAKKGYDYLTESYTFGDIESYSYMDPLKAKENIYDLLSDFEFISDQHRTNAIALMITPLFRGLYTSYTIRTPIGIYSANRAGAGKDTLACLTQEIFQGGSNRVGPITKNDNRGSEEEFRKNYTSALLNEKAFFHSDNNKGHIDNSELETVATAQIKSGRLLGTNIIRDFENTMEISLSMNVGASITSDMERRSILIELQMSAESTNNRSFKYPDILAHARANRQKYLDSIYSLIKSWFDAGMPQYDIAYASYPEWAKWVGSVMIYHNLGNPTKQIKSEYFQENSESEQANSLMTFLYEYYTTEKRKAQDFKFTRQQIIDKINDKLSDQEKGDQETKLNANEVVLNFYYIGSERSDKTKFGLFLTKYVGVKFSIKVGQTYEKVRFCCDKSQNSARNKYYFMKDDVNLVNIVNVSPAIEINNSDIKINRGSQKVDIVDKVDTDLHTSKLEKLHTLLNSKPNKEVHYSEIVKTFGQDQLAAWTLDGTLYNRKPEFVTFGRA